MQRKYVIIDRFKKKCENQSTRSIDGNDLLPFTKASYYDHRMSFVRRAWSVVVSGQQLLQKTPPKLLVGF